LIGGFPDQFSWTRNLLLLICLLLFNFGSILTSIGLLSYLWPDFALNFLNSQPNTHSLSPGIFLAIDTLTAVMIAPIVEESLMRGVFLHRFWMKWGINKALIIAAAIFAIGHANIIGMSMVALVLSLLYLKYKTLLVPIFFHAMNNTMVSLLQLSAGQQTASKPAAIADAQSTIWMGLVFVVISLPVLTRFLVKNWPKKDLVMPYHANSVSSTSL
jgi:membrane protease YdiL (CAAX protease family)